jgi:hypothetical protein
MGHGSRPDVDTVAALANWAAVDVASFFPSGDSDESLAKVTAYLHKDPRLTPEAAAALEQLVIATYSQLASDEPSAGGYRT